MSALLELRPGFLAAGYASRASAARLPDRNARRDQGRSVRGYALSARVGFISHVYQPVRVGVHPSLLPQSLEPAASTVGARSAGASATASWAKGPTDPCTCARAREYGWLARPGGLSAWTERGTRIAMGFG